LNIFLKSSLKIKDYSQKVKSHGYTKMKAFAYLNKIIIIKKCMHISPLSVHRDCLIETFTFFCLSLFLSIFAWCLLNIYEQLTKNKKVSLYQTWMNWSFYRRTILSHRNATLTAYYCTTVTIRWNFFITNANFLTEKIKKKIEKSVESVRGSLISLTFE
jgi:hypothetical protein